MPFELKNLSGLWALSLLAPLVLFYILKIRRKKLRVPSTWLWAAAQRDLLAKSPFKRLIVQVPLILQLLALILLALALSKPATRGGAIIGDHVAIIIDTSASMATRDGKGVQRIEAAKKAARDIIAGLGPGSDAMILEAGRDARVVSPLDRDRRRLQAAVDRLEARHVEGKLGRAVALASDRLRQLSGSTRLVVITDGALADEGALADARVPLDVLKVGEPAENAGIVRVDIRSGRDPATKRDQVQAFAVVANYGAKTRNAFVTLRQRNIKEPIASRRIQLKPGERAPVVLTFEPVRGDLGSGLVVELDPPDALTVDDRAYGRVPAGRKIPVVMAPANGNAWVKRALLADPDVDLLGVSLDQLKSAAVPDDALVVVSGACPNPTPGGDVLIINPPKGRCRTAVVGDALEKPVITSWEAADSRLRFLVLDGVALSSAHQIETDSTRDSLVRSAEGTVISDISLPGRTGTLLSFDPGDSNWPLKASFVLFVRNVVELARQHRARGVTGPARTGEAMRVRVPPDVRKVKLAEPGAKDEEAVELPARDGLVIVPEVGRAGFYFLSWQGKRPGSVLVAANLTSEAESDISERELDVAGAPVASRDAAEVADAFTDWTWLLAALALAFLVFDVWWLTRTPRIRRSDDGKPRLPDRRVAAGGRA